VRQLLVSISAERGETGKGYAKAGDP
jgi:hypothetical protein